MPEAEPRRTPSPQCPVLLVEAPLRASSCTATRSDSSPKSPPPHRATRTWPTPSWRGPRVPFVPGRRIVPVFVLLPHLGIPVLPVVRPTTVGPAVSPGRRIKPAGHSAAENPPTHPVRDPSGVEVASPATSRLPRPGLHLLVDRGQGTRAQPHQRGCNCLFGGSRPRTLGPRGSLRTLG